MYINNTIVPMGSGIPYIVMDQLKVPENLLEHVMEGFRKTQVDICPVLYAPLITLVDADGCEIRSQSEDGAWAAVYSCEVVYGCSYGKYVMDCRGVLYASNHYGENDL